MTRRVHPRKPGEPCFGIHIVWLLPEPGETDQQIQVTVDRVPTANVTWRDVALRLKGVAQALENRPDADMLTPIVPKPGGPFGVIDGGKKDPPDPSA